MKSYLMPALIYLLTNFSYANEKLITDTFVDAVKNIETAQETYQISFSRRAAFYHLDTKTRDAEKMLRILQLAKQKSLKIKITASVPNMKITEVELNDNFAQPTKEK